MPHLLAIDSGGTKCDALLVALDGKPLGRAICQRAGLSGRSEQALVEAVTQALDAAKLDGGELHLASFGRKLPDAFVAARKIKLVSAHVTNESDATFLLAGKSHGVIALAGTGAFVHARLRDGRELHLDGLGPLLGDYGGGFFIGREALRAALRSDWSPRHKTALRESVFAVYGAKTTQDLIPLNWTVQDRSEIARLAPFVDAAANDGDKIARRILQSAANALAETLRDAVQSRGIANENYPLIGTGSIATRSKIFWTHFCARAQKIAPRFHPQLTQLPAVAGIALSALIKLNAADAKTLRKNLSCI
jgi:N-acetylglucosamine kinase-like BadF-type ATPase